LPGVRCGKQMGRINNVDDYGFLLIKFVGMPYWFCRIVKGDKTLWTSGSTPGEATEKMIKLLEVKKEAEA